MESSWRAAVIWLCVVLLASQGIAIPTRDLSKADLKEDEIEIEEKRSDGIENDKNPFDMIQRLNTEKDLTALYEGDIAVIPKKTKVSDIPGGQEMLQDAINEKRNTVDDKRNLWVGKVVPYVIQPELDHVKDLIGQAIGDIQNNSCIVFKQRDAEQQYLKFFLGSGCWSYVGRYFGGINEISIGNGCNQKGIIIHEVLHALGFWHEQSRGDRDKFIEIFWDNIRSGVESNFQKNTKHEMLVNYDYDSVMHYGSYAFSANGKKTIVPIANPSAVIGQRNGLSPKDITELNVLYDCQSKSIDYYSTWGNWKPCDSLCYKERQRFCSHVDLSKCPAVDAYGVESERVQCAQSECNAPIAGNWGRWSSWSPCSKTCDAGVITRTRVCNDPAPKNGGSDCVGQSTMSSICKIKSCNLGPDDCEFENGMCGWVNETTGDQLDWQRLAGGTPSAGTGPTGDHTSGQGSYVYMEASSPAYSGQKAILTSKLMGGSSSGKKCLSFWYHMLGAAMGSLKVNSVDTVTGTTLLKTISGDQGNQWKNEEIVFSTPNHFKIQFVAERGYGYESDIAIDDIFFKDGSCKPEDNPLGMEDKSIKNYQLSSSSDWDLNHLPFYARLNQPGSLQWCASWNKHGTDQFIRVDFDKRQVISGVSVQGQATWDNWVTSYKIKYTEDGYLWKTLQENGIDKIFTGPTSRNTPVKHKFTTSLKAFGIIVNPQTFHGNDICLRIELYGYGCIDNVRPLGMASGRILNSQITASSIYDLNHKGYEARLNNYKVWCTYNNNAMQYVQVDLGKIMQVFAVATQGHPTWDNWVTSYEVTYSENGNLYYDILQAAGTWTRAVFTGNRDRHSIVKNKLPSPIRARYIRIHPKTYFGHDTCLRAEFYGCDAA
eukprot:gene7452-13218_t